MSSINRDVNFFATLGQVLYYEYLPGLVIPVKVDEIDDIHFASEEIQKKYGLIASTVWVHYTNEGIRCIGYESSTEKNKWGFKKISADVINEAPRCKQELWIDEPVGHAIEIGDGLFPTVEEALYFADRAKRRKRLRPHKKIATRRKKFWKWINTSRIKCGEKPVEIPKYEQKKVYVKR